MKKILLTLAAVVLSAGMLSAQDMSQATETAKMAVEILLDGKKPADMAVKTFDNGTATVNTDICEKVGLSYDDVAATFAPFCTKVQPIKTAESFE